LAASAMANSKTSIKQSRRTAYACNLALMTSKEVRRIFDLFVFEQHRP
jgi:hypothetical protein